MQGLTDVNRYGERSCVRPVGVVYFTAALMKSACRVPNQTNELQSPSSTSECPGCGYVQLSSFTFVPAYRDGSVLPPLFLLTQAIGEAR